MAWSSDLYLGHPEISDADQSVYIKGKRVYNSGCKLAETYWSGDKLVVVRRDGVKYELDAPYSPHLVNY